MSEETIAAIATPIGKGGVGIIRVSGSRSAMIAKAVLKKLPAPRQAELRFFYDEKGEALDEGLALYFPGPHSFTGEDVLELQGHGGPVVMQMLLNAVLNQGARLAKPGEFTERAYLNGKIDLAQAEAVGDLINASTAEAAIGATRSLRGIFSEKIEMLSETILTLRLLVEASIDFSEEEIELLSEAHLNKRIEAIQEKLVEILQTAKQGQLLKEGMHVAIVGRPNAGKSSLLNYLTQENTAIVTPIPGTTRDLVKATIQIEGIPVHLVDTAGIREEADEIEQEGMARGREQQHLVDKILLLIDAAQTEKGAIEEEIISTFGSKVIVVFNKIDLLEIAPIKQRGAFYISAKTGEGVFALLQVLKESMGAIGSETSVFISRQRHIQALQKALLHINQAKTQLNQYRAFELTAEELRYAQEALGEIVGKVSSDDLLGEIFSEFCIGK